MRRIELQNGAGYALVDDGDYPALRRHKWYLSTAGYAMCVIESGGVSRNYKMHRVIMMALHPSDEVDHIDRDRLNNQRSNLRFATSGENKYNAKLRRDNVSGFIGVSTDAGGTRWAVHVSANGRRHYVGRFVDAQEAAWVRDQYALELHGDFASLNFDYEEVACQAIQ